ncbi:autotransporter outer membrane beta-barrel domain-containing protein [Burkholderia cepacia]|uniref:autotransporter outer membrane beta-barrel domain-containing protein n=1 Tax=Burkholderia cepacia TaxID=292 RepID=UPI0007591006|nr:autotransporter outer membrane beta-barrel domain-containing protein [Burkholderia cepacia]KVW77452.1 hypothetical protein WL00_35960 [Burkholderia cepacia]
MNDFDPERCDGLACAELVRDGEDVRLVGSGTQVTAGTLATAGVKTLAEMYAEGRVYGSNMEYANPGGDSSRVLATGSRSKEVVFKDPRTGGTVKVLVYDNNVISYQTNSYTISTSAAAAGNQYIGTRIGSVDRSGGVLHVAIGDGSLPTNAAANMISMVAKDSSLFYADGTGDAKSKIVWESTNYVDMGKTLATALQTAGFNFQELRDVTLKNGQVFKIRSEADFKAYNTYLIGEMSAGRMNTSEYQTEFQKAYVQKAVNIDLVSGPVDLDDEVYKQIGTRTVIHAVGANASAEVAKGARIDANASYDFRPGAVTGVGAVLLADQGASVVNKGSIGSMRQGGSSGQYAMVARGADGSTISQAINEGVVNVGYYAGQSEYLDPENPNSQSPYGVLSHGNYGLGAMDRGIVRNAEDGIINVLAASSRGFSLANSSNGQGSNAGTVNVGVSYVPDGTTYLAGAPIYGVWLGAGTSFINEDTGEIYLGRGAQYMPGQVVGDVQNGKTTPLVGIYTNGAAKVENRGQITLGALTASSIGIYAQNNGAQPVVNGETGVIAVNGATGFENIGIYAENSRQVSNAGTIVLEGRNGIGIKAASVGTGSASVKSTGKIMVNGSMDAAGYRNYGIWAEGSRAGVVLGGGGVGLIGDKAVGVHARSGAAITVDGGTVNFVEGRDQIGFLAVGNGSFVDVKTAPSSGLNVSTEGSTLFRVEDGAGYRDGGAQLIASGANSTALQVTGVGSVINLDDANITVSGDSAAALKLEGGATGQMSGKAKLSLKDGTTAVVVDNIKYDLTGNAIGSAQSIFTNNANVNVTDARDVTAFVIKNGGRLVDSGNIHLSHGTAVEVVGGGSTMVAGANQGSITVDDGVAGIYVHGGASLSVSNGITVGGSASGILVAADAGRVVVQEGAHITGLGAGYGNLIDNRAGAATTFVDGATLEMQGSGAALFAESNLDAASHGKVLVTSQSGGKGIALSNEVGGQISGSGTVGGQWQIDVSGNGAGVYANTTGNLTIDSNSLALSGNGNAVRVDAANQVTIGDGARLFTPNMDAVLIVGNPKTLRNDGQIEAAAKDAVAVALDDSGHTFINGHNGELTGIVSLGNGRNQAVLEDSSKLAGALQGGSGDDTIVVKGDAQFENINGGVGGEDLLVFDGARYQYDGPGAIRNVDVVQLTGGSSLKLKHTLAVAKDGSDSASVRIDAGSTLAVVTDDAFVLNNPLYGAGMVSTDTGAKAFDFGVLNIAQTAANFTGTLSLGNSTFSLSGTNVENLRHATLESGQGSLATVGDGIQHIGGLAFAGGTVKFNASMPDQTVASSVIETDLLDASGKGQVRVIVPTPYVPKVPDVPGTANLLEQDDGNIGVKLVDAKQVVGSGGALVLQDQNGNAIGSTQKVDIAQGGDVVAKATYDFGLTTAPGDGLYVNYGLRELDLQSDRTLTLAQAPSAAGAAADLSARLTGEGNLAIEAGAGTISVSNARSDYTGETVVRSGRLKLGADNALGQTSALRIVGASAMDLNGRAQTIGTLEGQAGALLDLNGGTLTIASGGTSSGSLSGTGRLNLLGGELDVLGDNAGLSVETEIASNAVARLSDVKGLGTGAILTNGTLVMDAAAGVLSNAIGGKGVVALGNGADVSVSGDNSAFAGRFDLATGATMTVGEVANLGVAKVTNAGTLVVDTMTDWALANVVSGAGDLVKRGVGTLEAGGMLGYTGRTDIREGVLLVGTANKPDVSLGGVGAGSVNVAEGAILAGLGLVQGSVFNAGTLSMLNALPGHTGDRAGTFTLAAGLTNSGSVNLAGGHIGNRLIVKGDYVGHGGKLVLSTVTEDDNSETDRLVIDGGHASGGTSIVIKQAGGRGQQTNQGIRLVETQNGGTTDAQAFALDAGSDGYRNGKGTIAAGAYDYALKRGGNGGNTQDWYLVSSTEGDSGGGTPGDGDGAPRVPGRDVVRQLRPEVGAYQENREVAMGLFHHTLHDRRGEAPSHLDASGRLIDESNGWIRVVASKTTRDGNGGLTIDNTRRLVHAGADVLRFDVGQEGSVSLGGMGAYSSVNTWSAGDAGKAQGSLDGYGVGVYGTWYGKKGKFEGPYVDAWMMYGRFSNKVGDAGLATEQYHSQVWTGSIEGGYSVPIFDGGKTRLYVEPQAQVIYTSFLAANHAEAGKTLISGQNASEVTTRLGLRLHGRIVGENSGMDLQPFAELNWWHGKGTHSMVFNGDVVNDALPRNRVEGKVGLQGDITKSISSYGQVGFEVGSGDYRALKVQVGAKYAW